MRVPFNLFNNFNSAHRGHIAKAFPNHNLCALIFFCRFERDFRSGFAIVAGRQQFDQYVTPLAAVKRKNNGLAALYVYRLDNYAFAVKALMRVILLFKSFFPAPVTFSQSVSLPI